MFSRRLGTDLVRSALAVAREAYGEPRFDLTATNPTLCDLPYPAELLEALSDARGLEYHPDALGHPEAREAIAALYRGRGAPVTSGRIVLTASSSEAYAFVFKLLADPGDVVLVPSPSYPLLTHLAELEGLRTRPYRLDPSDGWRPDPAVLEGAGGRAVVSVHPNNPSGSWVDPTTAIAIERHCAATGAGWIVDEVFLDYTLSPGRPAASFAGRDAALTFVLGGLSKSVGLPQLKLGWVVVSGPSAVADEAVERLAFVADQYLSPSTPVQLALPELLSRGTSIRAAISERCRRNLGACVEALAPIGALRLYPPDAGWSAVLRFPDVIDEQELAIELLQRHGVAVQPGYLFDFEQAGHLVISLLPNPVRFDEGLRRLIATLTAKL